MTWQLLKRDRMWLAMTATTTILYVLIAVGSAYLPLPDRLPTREAFIADLAIVPAVTMSCILFLAFNFYSQRSLYEAALPIATRDLWLARLLLFLSLTWVPLLAAIAFGFPSAPLLDAAAVYTVLVLVAKCVRIRNLGTLQWVRAAGFRVFLLAPMVMIFLKKPLQSIHWPALPPASTVLAICGLAGTALFLLGWSTVPKSFQIAPADLDLIRGREAEPLREPSRFLWAPVFRSISGPPMMILILLFFFNSALGYIWAASIAVGGAHTQIRGRCRWLLGLPISLRQLFGLTVLPQTLGLVAACLAGPVLNAKHPLSGRGQLVEVGLVLGFLYGQIFLSELPAWRPLSKLRAVRFGVWILWAPFVIGALAPLFALTDTQALQRLADSLPGTWWQLAGMLMIPIAATYFLAEKAFREQEYRQVYIETVNSTNLRGNSI